MKAKSLKRTKIEENEHSTHLYRWIQMDNRCYSANIMIEALNESYPTGTDLYWIFSPEGTGAVYSGDSRDVTAIAERVPL
jgi:hypothetical protein